MQLKRIKVDVIYTPDNTFTNFNFKPELLISVDNIFLLLSFFQYESNRRDHTINYARIN